MGTSSTPAATTVPVPAPAPGGAAAAGSGNPAIQLSDLQSILSNMQVPAGGEGSSGPAVDLSTALTGEAMQPLLQNQEHLDNLVLSSGNLVSEMRQPQLLLRVIWKHL